MLHASVHDSLPLLVLQPVVDAIRATGARNLIVVGAARAWARIADGFSTYPVNDTNWAAAVHSYWLQSDFGTGFKYCQVWPLLLFIRFRWLSTNCFLPDLLCRPKPAWSKSSARHHGSATRLMM